MTMKNLFVFVAIVALTSSACGASINVQSASGLPDPVQHGLSGGEVEELVDGALETATFVVDGYAVPVRPAAVTIFDPDIHTAEEAEEMLDLADAEELGCQRSPIDREAWVCMP